MTLIFILAVIFSLLLISYGINSIIKFKKITKGIIPLLFAFLAIYISVITFKPAYKIIHNRVNNVSSSSSSTANTAVYNAPSKPGTGFQVPSINNNDNRLSANAFAILLSKQLSKTMGDVDYNPNNKTYRIALTNNALEIVNYLKDHKDEAESMGWNNIENAVIQISKSIHQNIGEDYTVTVVSKDDPNTILLEIKNGTVISNYYQE
ncbi:MAG: TolB-like 6-bladed beta-propeller domain-containing protein [Lactobacillaceae bacterium]|jgi:hypothetical protein|nr:TolB-like 6-bladed beta-propeller domain-containing protein [Lactobacillaceae bacterium]